MEIDKIPRRKGQGLWQGRHVYGPTGAGVGRYVR